MLVLASALKQRGHDVVLCGTPSFSSWAQEIEIPFHPSGLDLQQVLQANKDIHSSSVRLLLHSLRISHDELRSQFAAVREVAAGADLVVSGGSQFSGGSVALHTGAPHVVMGYVPAAFHSSSHAPTLVPWVNTPRWLNRTLWKGYDLLAMATVGRTINTQRGHLGLPAMRSFHHDAYAPQHRLLAADPELCPLPDDLAGRCTQTGAIMLTDERPLPPDVDAFIRAGSAPVYLGFGSMVNQDAARTTRVILDAVQAAGVRAVISKGWAELGNQGSQGSQGSQGDGTLPSSCLAVGPIPHHVLFPRMAAIVHHGGAGTIAAAARAGVPQVIVPHIADQFYFAHRIVTLGLGPPPIARAKLTAARLAEALRLAATSEPLRRQARSMAERLAARRGVEVSVAFLEQLAEQHRGASLHRVN